MKKVFTMLLSLLLVLQMGMVATADTVPVADESSTEEKLYCDATLDDDFKEQELLITFTQAATVINKVYTPEDFTELFGVAIVSVEDLTYIAADAPCGRVNFENYHQMFLVKISLPGKQAVLDAVKAIETHPYVLSVTPNYIFYLDDWDEGEDEVMSPTEPVLSETLSLEGDAVASVAATASGTSYTNDPLVGLQDAINKMELPEAWEKTTGDSRVLVGVIDTGIDGTHPDIIPNLNTSLGKDCTGEDPTGVQQLYLTDLDGHGTHVAGIIGAKGNNSIGVSGVCWNVELVSLRVFKWDSEEQDFVSDWSWIAQAVIYASQYDIDILNCSVGGYGSYTDLQVALQNYNGLFVCSAGNDGLNVDLAENYHYPSGYNCANIISVANTTIDDELNDNSNYGATKVDLAAPGTGILSTYPLALCSSTGSGCGSSHKGYGYHTESGTSMAAPQVTGVAALLLSYYPDLTTAELKEYILDGVDPVAGLTGKCVTGGRLNAADSLTMLDEDKCTGTIDGRYVTGDFNGDGKDDTALMADLGSARGAQIRVSLSHGNSAEYWDTWFQSAAFKPSMIGSRMVAGDFNGDGKDDIAAFCDHSTVVDANRGTMYVFLSNGTSFSSWPQIWYQYDYFLATVVEGRFVAGDFNGDGKDDISCMLDYSAAMPWGNSRIMTFISTGSSFTAQSWFNTDAFPAMQVTDRFTAGDFNGDGKDDIACLFDYSYQQAGKCTMFVFISTGSNFGNWPQTWFTTESFYADKVTGRFTASDFNGDGKDDVAAMYDYSNYQPYGTSTTFVFVSNGSSFGNWPQSWFVTSGFAAGMVTDRFEAGDLTGDGKADISTMYNYVPAREVLGSVFVFTSNGSNFGSWPQKWISTPDHFLATATATATATAQAAYEGNAVAAQSSGTYETDEEESYRIHCQRLGLGDSEENGLLF